MEVTLTCVLPLIMVVNPVVFRLCHYFLEGIPSPYETLQYFHFCATSNVGLCFA